MRIYHFLLFALLALYSCDGIEDLQLKSQPEVEFRGMNKGSLELDLIVQISNPNSQPFKVKNAAFDIFVNEQNVGSSNMTEQIKIDGN